jgi:DNA-3-methyladenine glycosylase
VTPFPADFFARPTLTVARDLLGRYLVREHSSGETLVGRIVETEGYTQDDPAFHGWNLYDEETGEVRREGRAADLFGAPGTAYVYLIYGMHWLVNVVTEPEGTGGAVLVRAVEPVQGRDRMQSLRSAGRREVDLTNGPGKLAEAFGIDGDQHGTDLTAPPLYFAEGNPVPDAAVATSTRIGITKGVDREWRWFIDGNRFVSKATPSGEKG